MSVIFSGGRIVGSGGSVFALGGAAPAAPTNVTMINQGGATNADDSSPASSNSNTLAIQWDDMGADSYNVYRSTNGGSFTLLANVTKTTWTGSTSGNVMTVVGATAGGAQPIYPCVRFAATGLLAETQVYDAYQAQSTTGTGGAGTYPINRSQTLTSRTFSACYYVDTAATGAVSADKSRPGTIYDYNVTSVVSGVESSQSTNLVLWGYHNGFTNWGKGTNNGSEVSFGSPFPNTIYNSTAGTPGPQGGPFQMEYQVNGGFQPSVDHPLTCEWQLEVGAFKYLVFDFNPGSSYTGWPLNVGVVSGVPEGDVFGLMPAINAFSGSYGPTPVANTWGTYKVPIGLLGYNKNSFTGSISGSTLTVNTVGSGLFGTAGIFDNAGYITGTGLPVPAWIHVNLTGGTGPGNSGPGSTWTVWGAPYTPGVHSGTAVNVTASSDGTWVFHKHQCYKFSIYDSGGPTQQSYLNNLGFSRT